MILYRSMICFVAEVIQSNVLNLQGKFKMYFLLNISSHTYYHEMKNAFSYLQIHCLTLTIL